MCVYCTAINIWTRCLAIGNVKSALRLTQQPDRTDEKSEGDFLGVPAKVFKELLSWPQGQKAITRVMLGARMHETVEDL